MDVNFSEVIRLLEVVIWPGVIIALMLIFRRELPKAIQALGGRISRLSAAGVTLEFAASQPAAETIRVLDEIKKPSPTGAPPASGAPALLELARASHPADYLMIDLRSGQAWLTSRLYLFAVALSPALALRCLVFVGTRDVVPYFLGLASPNAVARALERRYPWLRVAMVETQLMLPLVAGPPANRYVSWYPDDVARSALRRLTQGPTSDRLDVEHAEALEGIVRSLVSPTDLFQPGQIDIFVNRFLDNQNLKRPHSTAEPGEDWVRLETVDEHAHWIKDERHLLDLLGGDLRREHVVINSTSDNDTLAKAVLRRRGDFVAVIDSEGRFDRLIDRAAMIERIAAGAEQGG